MYLFSRILLFSVYKKNPTKYIFFYCEILTDSNSFSMKSKFLVFLSILCILLIVLSVNLYRTMVEQNRTSEELESRLTEMQEKERNAVIVRRISKQMENIAYQQKEVSDRQREEAMMQSHIANEMRMQAEVQRRNAEYAEKQAIDAYKEAENQRTIAQERQLQAESAKNIADTLGYIALARSLSSLSQTQFQAKNFDLSALMAYAAYTFATRYNGNLYFPEIYNALAVNSQAIITWNQHKGGITKIIESPVDTNIFYSISKYGEVIRWIRNSSTIMSSSILFNDSSFDFRDIFIDINQTIYALSFDGRLVIIEPDGNSSLMVFPEIEKEFRFLVPLNNDILIAISGAKMFLLSREKKQVQRTVSLSNPILSICKKQDEFLMFADNGLVMMLHKNGGISEDRLPINVNVTSCDWSENLNTLALGTSDGTILLINEKGQIYKRLIGHQSTVTKLSFWNDSLFSASYDLKLKMWNKNLESINLLISSNWIYSFYMPDGDTVWVGDESGTLSRVLISPKLMANRIKASLSRNFTQEEWNTYIGVNVPYEYLKN